MSTWHRRPLFGVDLETTGVDPETDRIVTAATVRFGGGLATERQSWQADPGVDIPAEATAVHGFTTRAARTAGRPAREVVEEVTATCAAAVSAGLPLVVMNASFDLTMLDREARRHDVVPLSERVEPLVLDPRVLDRHVDRFRSGSRTLLALCAHYVVRLDDAHDAAEDAHAACAVTWKLAHRHRHLTRLDLPELHARQVQWAGDQQRSLRDYFARTPGREQDALSVRQAWPLVPAPRPGSVGR